MATNPLSGQTLCALRSTPALMAHSSGPLLREKKPAEHQVERFLDSLVGHATAA